MRTLCRSAAFLLLIVASVFAAEEGVIAEAGKKTQDVVDTAGEKISSAAEKIKNAAVEGWNKGTGAAEETFNAAGEKIEQGK
ncbi:unnamed protein product, partial [Cylicostephanus goldi]